MEARDIAECIILNLKGEVLLQKKTLDYPTEPGGPWTFWGGSIEEGETALEAIKRELNEEIGFCPEKIRLFKEYDYIFLDKYYGKEHVFIAQLDKELSEIKLMEGAGFAVFSLEEAKELNLSKLHIKIIRDLTNNKNRKYF